MPVHLACVIEFHTISVFLSVVEDRQLGDMRGFLIGVNDHWIGGMRGFLIGGGDRQLGGMGGGTVLPAFNWYFRAEILPKITRLLHLKLKYYISSRSPRTLSVLLLRRD